MSIRRRLRWHLDPLYGLIVGVFPPIALIVGIGAVFPGLWMAVRVVMAVLLSSIGIRLLSTIDGFGRFPQDLYHAGVRIDRSNMDEIGTESHSIFDIFIIHASVGVVAGLILAFG
ncbi:hypothetical protein MNBD_PLANCTO03-2019 [hydrothermal vent metagenome]|uniref:Uncharacterized protein n=1 Tax=hydrothermal vent metagenome TaxID=652676 RepID=A0A3B1E6H3_9ZZZZ